MPEVVTQCVSLLDREALAWERDVVNSCILSVRNACCIADCEERARVAQVCASNDALQRIDFAMERHSEDETLLDNGRCATYNLSLAAIARASVLEKRLSELLEGQTAAASAEASEEDEDAAEPSTSTTTLDPLADARGASASGVAITQARGRMRSCVGVTGMSSAPELAQAQPLSVQELLSAPVGPSAPAPLLPASAPGSPSASVLHGEVLPTSPGAPAPSGYVRLPSGVMVLSRVAEGDHYVTHMPGPAHFASLAAPNSVMQLRVAVAGVAPIGVLQFGAASPKPVSDSHLVPVPPLGPPAVATPFAAPSQAEAVRDTATVHWRRAALSLGAVALIAAILAIIGWLM